MAILESITYGGKTFEVPDKFSELTDVEIPANVANGSILTLQNGKWRPTASVLNTPLTGLDTSLTGDVTASDTILQAFGKLSEGQTTTVDLSKLGSDAAALFDSFRATLVKVGALIAVHVDFSVKEENNTVIAITSQSALFQAPFLGRQFFVPNISVGGKSISFEVTSSGYVVIRRFLNTQSGRYFLSTAVL